MRLFCTFLGALLGGGFGVFVGLALTMIFVMVLAGGNTLAGGFFGLIGVPLGFILGLLGGGIGGRRFTDFWQSDATKRQRIQLLGNSIAIPTLFAAGLAVLVYQTNSPPKDKTLLAHFSQHEQEFEHLVQLAIKHPGLQREDPSLIDIPPQEVAQYQKLLKKAGIPRGFRQHKDGGPIEFYYYSWGSAISSDIFKGFAYCTKPPKPIVASLDPETPNHAYRHIKGNWYLFYRYISG